MWPLHTVAVGQKEFWLCDPTWEPQVSRHSQEEGRKPDWGQVLTYGNEDTTLIANLQSPRECPALAKWVSAASHKN